MTNWEERYYQAEAAFAELKTLTKNVHASKWTPEYRELAERIHTLGRDVFFVELGFGSATAVPDATGFSLDEDIKSQGF
jgi:hypothetical protein